MFASCPYSLSLSLSTYLYLSITIFLSFQGFQLKLKGTVLLSSDKTAQRVEIFENSDNKNFFLCFFLSGKSRKIYTKLKKTKTNMEVNWKKTKMLM